ncbi:MAG TPA: PhnD/SsuA/transferrin family substrate-binding protein [Acidiferrobacterales bacterium]
MHNLPKALISLVVSFLFSGQALAAEPAAASTRDPAAAKVSYRAPLDKPGGAPQIQDSSVLVLTAPPRESPDAGQALYGPVAEHLSKVIGKQVVYKHPGNWGVYQGQMQKGAYDLVFDGPHFNGWRVDRIQHNMLVKVPGDFVFVALVRKDNTRIQDIKQLAGYTICAMAPPNLGTLTMLDQFTNPARQPVIVNTDGWANIYKGMIEGKCAAAVVPLKKLTQFDADGAQSRIVFRAPALPDNAFSAGPRISPGDQAKIAQALLAPESLAITEKIRAKYGAGKPFVRASNQEYAGLGEYLRNEWGYY